MNVSEMTCEQVNEAIAKLRLEWVDDSAETVREGWRQINVPLRPFDYCHDWAACGPCLEEMYLHWLQMHQEEYGDGHDEDHPAENGPYEVWEFLAERLADMLYNDPSHLPEAIARAHYAWRNADAEEEK